MAQKKRGLGRGLQALIPEAQVEDVAVRPTDVFFPTRGRGGDAGEEADSSTRAAQIAEVLMEPSRRHRSGARRSTRSADSARPVREGSDAPRTTSARAAGGSTSGSGTSRRPKGGAARTEAPEAGRSDVDRDEAQASPSRGSTRRSSRRTATTAADVSRETCEGSPAAEADDLVGPASSEGLVPVPGATFAELPVEIVVPNPRQPRQVFDDDDIEELAASIQEVGLLQPVVVRRVDGDDGTTTYELIMGERRLRAAKVAGLDTIPAVVRYTEDEDLLRDALLENLHRVQLNPLEEAAAYQQLLEDFSCTHAELSQRIARSRSQISNTLRLLKLPALVQRRVAAGVLSAGHARALLGLPDASAMERLAQRIVAEGLSVRAVEELVALHDDPQVPVKVARSRSTTLPALSTRLSDTFDTRVKVTRSAKKGKITIEFAGDEDLARLVEALAPGTSLAED